MWALKKNKKNLAVWHRLKKSRSINWPREQIQTTTSQSFPLRPLPRPPHAPSNADEREGTHAQKMIEFWWISDRDAILLLAVKKSLTPSHSLYLKV